MPRRERQVQGRSIVAAGRSFSGRAAKRESKSIRPGEEWQRAAYTFYDTVPEYHQGCAVIGALLSRARLVVLEDGKPAKNPVAIAALEELFGGPDGQSEMLRQYGVHFTIAGEGWLMGPGDAVDEAGDPQNWVVAAPTQVSRTNGEWRVAGKRLKGKPVAKRIWIPHPELPNKADADSRSALTALSQIVQIDKRTSAQIDSRLAGNGLLLLPSETSFPARPTRAINPGDPPTHRDGVEAGDAQGLADLIYENALEAIEDPASAAAMLPLIGEAEGEHINQVKHLTWFSELDKMAPKMREEKILSVARSLRLPPEVLLGSAGSNHWNAWLSDESSVKIHGEPLLKILTTSLTSVWLWEALEGEVDGDFRRFTIAADTSQMRLRPNRSKEATEMYDRGELSAAAMRRENGFDEADAPTEAERRRQLLFNVARGSTTPEIVEAALRKEGVDLELLEVHTREPVERRPDPSLLEHPRRGIPEREAAAIEPGLVWACEQIVDRALQRAGNRIKAKFNVKEPPTRAARLYLHFPFVAEDLDDLLKDAWDSCSLDDYGVDAVKLARALDYYTRMLMMSRREPSRDSIGRALALLLTQNPSPVGQNAG